tara:strand:- start:52 stop:5130 length:5079 start_codon:yes stop_codon:yes gene_type:complete
MAIDKLLPRYLNTDDDERIITSVQMSDAQNLRVSVDDDGDALLIKNAYGNQDISGTIENGTMPTGTSVTIGSISDETKGQLYYFVYNSNANHTIFRYDQNGKKLYIVYQDSVLQFSATSHVQASLLTNNNEDILLYFNTGDSAPKKINATLAEATFTGAGGYPGNFLRSGTDEQKLLYITTAKQPPLDPPVLLFDNDNTIPNVNNIFQENFQFAYLYEYIDGEESALSPYTQMSTTDSQLKDGFINQGQRNFFNRIKVTVKNSVADVRRIKILARRGGTKAFEVIKEIDNVVTGLVPAGTSTIDFTDDQGYLPLAAQQADKVYDNVPQVADSQAIANGRLFYGGYTDGYPNSTLDVDVLSNYNDKPTLYDINVTQPTATLADLNLIKIDLSNLVPLFAGGPLTEDYELFISFSSSDGDVSFFNEVGNDRHFTWALSSSNVAIQGDNNELPSVPETALAGMRFPSIPFPSGPPGPNADGPILGPPNISFTKQQDTSNTDVDAIVIQKIKSGGIKLNTSGLQVKKQILIPSGTSNISDLYQILVSNLVGNYPVQATPQGGQAGFSVLNARGADNVSAAFNGSGFVHLQSDSFDSSTNIATFKRKIEKITLTINKLTVGKNQTSVLNPSSQTSSFDFIEDINTRGESNALYPFNFTDNGRGTTVKITKKNNRFSFGSVKRVGPSLQEGGCFMIKKNQLNGTKCFKGGSSHQLGLVYFDNRGRSSGVQKFPSQYIEPVGNRSTENNIVGFANLTVRLSGLAPEFAARYSPVYVGKGNIQNKIQYGIGGAYLAFNDQSNQGGFASTQNIYLSLNTLQGKENSYVNQMGALTNYGFAQGDRLRIVRFGDDLKSNSEYRVVNFVTLTADSLKNPILDRSSPEAILNTTGDFLVIEERVGEVGFNSTSISNNNTNWNKNCVVEIYNENLMTGSEFYYEIGQSFPIVNQVYGTQRPSTTATIKVISYDAVNDDIIAYSTQKLYKGDRIREDASPNRIIIVGNVMENNDEAGYTHKFYGTSVNTWVANEVKAITVTSDEAVMTIDQGDSYFRVRTLFTGASPSFGDEKKNQLLATTQNQLVDFIEDFRVSDFYPSNYTSLGRLFPYLPNARRTKRYGSITYSEQFIVDSQYLGLSSFNLQLVNFEDFAYEYGSIRGLESYADSMYVIQERRAGVVPVSRSIIQTGSGEDIITATEKVLGPINYYMGDYGCNTNAESIASYRGDVFFVDNRAGKVLRIQPQTGLTVISEQLVDSFFTSRMFSTLPTAINRRYIGGVDRENYEYIISSPALTTSVLTIEDNLTGATANASVKTDDAAGFIESEVMYDDSLTYDWDTDPHPFQSDQEKFNEAGSALLIGDTQTSNPVLGVAESLSPNNQLTQLTSVPVTITTQATTAFGQGTLSQLTQALTLTSDDTTLTLNNSAVTLNAFTIAYDLKKPQWNSRYSYVAEEICSMANKLYTFKAGKLYEHNSTTARNTFYGVAGPSIIEVVANADPSMVKVYEAISVEGDSNSWSCTLNNGDQTSTIASSVFEEREGFYYAPIHQDSTLATTAISTTSTASITSVSGTSEIFGLGVVATTSTGDVTKITFKNAINNMGFPLGTVGQGGSISGTALYKINGNALSPLGLSAVSVSGEKELNCNVSVIGKVSTNDEVVLISSSPIEGDPMRDYYIKTKLTSNLTTPLELYAINLIFAKSNLANNLG